MKHSIDIQVIKGINRKSDKIQLQLPNFWSFIIIYFYLFFNR